MAVFTGTCDIVAVIVTVCEEANADGFAPISRYLQTAIM